MKSKTTLLVLCISICFALSTMKSLAQTALQSEAAYKKAHADDAKYLNGFDEKAIVTELKKKGIPEAEWRGILHFRKHEYIDKQKGIVKPTPYFSKQDPGKLRDLAATNCPNAGFEDTTFTNWSAGTGSCANYPTPTVWTPGFVSGPINDIANTGNSQQDLLTDPNGFDPVAINSVTGNHDIPYLAPGGGHVSVRLGNEWNGSGTEFLSYPIYVTPNNTSFTYQYAIILQSTGHTAIQSPRFSVSVLDSTGNAVSGPCASYNIDGLAASTDPSFFPFNTPSGVSSSGASWITGGYYKPWTTVTIDLTVYLGQQMTIKFVTQDCTLGGHFGYAYIDASCSQLANQVSFCLGDTMTILNALPGYAAYQWYSVNSNNSTVITNATSDTLQVHNPVVGQQYAVAMANATGCGSSILTTLAYTNLILNKTIHNETCTGTNDGWAYVNESGAQGPFTYMWIDSATSANVTQAAHPDSLLNAGAGTYYVTVQSAGGCSATDTVVICVQPTCFVWPGDADANHIVDNNDLLPIGLYYGQTGTVRASVSNSWQAYPATNWGTNQTNGADIKNVDCNGDGVIDNNDTLAVNLNFNLTHAISAYTNNGIKTINPDLYFVTGSNTYNAGDMVDVEVWAGKSTLPVNNLYGVAFNVQYDASLVQPGTESITYPASWLGTQGTDAIKISKIDALSNIAYGGITLINHSNASGFGKIADFKFQVKSSVATASYLHLSVSNYKADDSIGTEKLFNTINDSILINTSTVGINKLTVNNSISIYPNPFTTQTTISFSSEQTNTSIKITDVVGKEIKTINFTGTQYILEKGIMKPGIYFVQITSFDKLRMTQEVVNRKVVVQ